MAESDAIACGIWVDKVALGKGILQ